MKKISRFIFLFIASIITFSHAGHACNVPVFRYALERWAADSYEVIVFYRDALSSEEREIVEWLEGSSKETVPYSNYTVQTVDVSDPAPEFPKELLKITGDNELPQMAVLYPGPMRRKYPMWAGPLSADTAKRLVDSPARQEIARRILDGESAVWILLESGNSKRDNAAEAALKSHIAEARELLELPVQYITSPDFVPVRETGPELRVDFSVVRISRDDPEESMLVQMLMKTEPDLDDYASYPMAFPVYGRGRVLFALVGEGIEKRNIIEACAFVTGPCSCQIKGLNPGVDLLMKVEWDSSFGSFIVQEMELPPLVGFSELVVDAVAETQSKKADDESVIITANDKAGNRDSSLQKKTDSNTQIAMKETGISTGSAPEAAAAKSIPEDGVDSGSGHLMRNILIVLALFAVLIVILSFTVIKSFKRDNR